jgi:energy-coupling factor transporter ATP-binding protein EcfA2
LAAVLATHKPFVALDEPLAGLHPTVRDAVLIRIKEEGRTRSILLAEHDLSGALEVADCVVVFRLGSIVAELPASAATAKDRRPQPEWAAVHRELRRPGVTLQLSWEEYREAHPNGYG